MSPLAWRQKLEQQRLLFSTNELHLSCYYSLCDKKKTKEPTWTPSNRTKTLPEPPRGLMGNCRTHRTSCAPLKSWICTLTPVHYAAASQEPGLKCQTWISFLVIFRASKQTGLGEALMSRVCGAAGPTGLLIDGWRSGLAAVTRHPSHRVTHSGRSRLI